MARKPSKTAAAKAAATTGANPPGGVTGEARQEPAVVTPLAAGSPQSPSGAEGAHSAAQNASSPALVEHGQGSATDGAGSLLQSGSVSDDNAERAAGGPAAPPAAAPPAAGTAEDPVLVTLTARSRDGRPFRRCGVLWGADFQTVALFAAQAERLRADPHIVVRPLD